MINFSRTNKSLLSKWWWTIDHQILYILLILMAYGAVMILAASPSVATRIGLTPFYFVQRHLVFLIPSLFLMFGVSLLSRRQFEVLNYLLFLGFLALLLLTLFIGVEIKGAKRWIHFIGFSLQPSEFIKPFFIVVTASLLAKQAHDALFPGKKIAAILFIICVSLLVLQPDMGMTFLISITCFSQFFLAGLPLSYLFILGGIGTFSTFMAYQFLPHFASRINRFLNPESGDNYQIEQSLDAFINGHIFGTGPGQGTVKMYLPDAHADFIFSVVGEEFGLIWCLVLVALFATLILKSLWKIAKEEDQFIILAMSGLLIQFGLQAIINMASSLNLMPTKGMTLPFISYGGSSLIALAFSAGAMLCLTKRK